MMVFLMKTWQDRFRKFLQEQSKKDEDVKNIVDCCKNQLRIIEPAYDGNDFNMTEFRKTEKRINYE